MAPSSRDHYTAIIEIKQVQFHTRDLRAPASSQPVDGAKDVEDVARIVLRDSSLSGLVFKATQHLELIDPAEELTKTDG